MNVMLDIETTGVEPGCCILSIGAVPFLTDSPVEYFYERISHQSSLRAGFADNPDTISWWDKQKPEMQDEAFGGVLSIHRVLESFCSYLNALGDPRDIHVWGNGKDFDNIIVAHTLKKLHLKQPWHYRNNWCYRDFVKLFPLVPKPDNLNLHNALEDAKTQARHMELTVGILKQKGIINEYPILPT